MLHQTMHHKKVQNVFIRTTCFSDTQDIADELKTAVRHLSILQRIDKVSAKRIIDF